MVLLEVLQAIPYLLYILIKICLFCKYMLMILFLVLLISIIVTSFRNWCKTSLRYVWWLTWNTSLDFKLYNFRMRYLQENYIKEFLKIFGMDELKMVIKPVSLLKKVRKIDNGVLINEKRYIGMSTIYYILHHHVLISLVLCVWVINFRLILKNHMWTLWNWFLVP